MCLHICNIKSSLTGHGIIFHTTHQAWVAVARVGFYTCPEHCASGHRGPRLNICKILHMCAMQYIVGWGDSGSFHECIQDYRDTIDSVRAQSIIFEFVFKKAQVYFSKTTFIKSKIGPS